MIVIIPLGGIGSRFKFKGFTEPKALVPVNGKPIIFWLLDNLKVPEDWIVCIPYNKEYEAHNLESILSRRYDKIQFRFLCLQEQTKGAAETLLKALKHLKNEDSQLGKRMRNMPVPVCSIDSDAFYTVDVLENWKGKNAVYTFNDTNPDPIFSYVKCQEVSTPMANRPAVASSTTMDSESKDMEGSYYLITEIVEKEKISDYANSGLYAFESHEQVITFCEAVIEKNIRQKNEFYTSSVIGQMLQEGIEFYRRPVANKHFFSLGTPEQVAQFNTTYLLDLDGTLVTTDETYVRVWNNLLLPYGLSVDDDFFETFIKGKSDLNFLKYLIPEITQEMINDFSRKKDEGLIKELERQASEGIDLKQLLLIKGVESFFHKSKNSRVAIVTSCNKAAAEFLVKATGLEDFVTLIVASEDTQLHKPHPAPFRQAITTLGVSADRCIICEDSSSGLLAASRACVGKVCFFTGGRGLSEARSSLDSEIQDEANFDIIITDWATFDPATIAEDLCSDLLTGAALHPLSPRNDYYFYAQRIKEKLSHLPVKAVNHCMDNLKTGYICDINAFNVIYNNGTQATVIFKLSNFGNELSKTASELDMYEKEGYFYERLSTLLENDVPVPKCHGVIRHRDHSLSSSGRPSAATHASPIAPNALPNAISNGQSSPPLLPNAVPMTPTRAEILAKREAENRKDQIRLGIILEDLRVHPGRFNCDLNTDIELLIKVISTIFKMHDLYYFPSAADVIPSMKSLVQPKDITYYQTLVSNRFEKFIQRNGIFMTQKNRDVCTKISENYRGIATALSEFPLSFCHGDLKSPNIFYKYKKLPQSTDTETTDMQPGSTFDAEPVLLDWQYIHLNKGVSDIVFLLVESIKFDPITVELACLYYFRLWQQKKKGLTYDQYIREFKLSLCLFPYFVMVWFNSEDPDKLIDRSFPIKFMKNLLDYYTHYLDVDFFNSLNPETTSDKPATAV